MYNLKCLSVALEFSLQAKTTKFNKEPNHYLVKKRHKLHVEKLKLFNFSPKPVSFLPSLINNI